VKAHAFLAWMIWAFAVTFLFYEFFIRVFPTAMVKELMETFSVTAGALGTLSAFYFYSYAPMQIPVGLMIDRFGAQKLLVFASLLCGIGSLLFATSHQLTIAEIGRFLMGIGSAFGFVSMIYVCSHWFPLKRLALLVGLGNSIGMLGAVGAEGPLVTFVSKFGWRVTVHVLAFVGIALAIMFYLSVRLKPRQHIKQARPRQSVAHLLANLKKICSHPPIYLNAIIALLFYMTTAGFASLWGIPFLAQEYGIKKSLAGYIVSMIFVGWIVGGPLIGIVSDRFKRRKPFLCIGILLTGMSLIPVIYMHDLPLYLLFILLFFVGFFSSAQLLNFSLAVELGPPRAKGTSLALTNLIVASGSSIIQPLLGTLLDMGWDQVMKDGAPLYSTADYRQAMVSFPATLLLAFTLLFFLKVRSAK